MGRNKWMEKTGLYKTIEERGLGKYREAIEESVNSLKIGPGWNSGGEEQAANAYKTVIEDAPEEIVGECITEIQRYISKKSEERKSGYRNDNGWRYDTGSESKDIADCTSLLKGMGGKAAMLSLKKIAESCGGGTWSMGKLAYCFSRSMRSVPEGELEEVAKEIHSFFDKHSYEESYAFSSAYGAAYELPLSVRKDALDDIRGLSNKADALKLSEAYATLAKTLPEEMLLEKASKVRKIAQILGADKALRRADEIAIEYVESITE